MTDIPPRRVHRIWMRLEDTHGAQASDGSGGVIDGAWKRGASEEIIERVLAAAAQEHEYIICDFRRSGYSHFAEFFNAYGARGCRLVAWNYPDAVFEVLTTGRHGKRADRLRVSPGSPQSRPYQITEIIGRFLP